MNAPILLFLIFGLIVGVLFWGLVVWGLFRLWKSSSETEHHPRRAGLHESATGPHQGVVLVGAAAALLFLLGVTAYYMADSKRSAVAVAQVTPSADGADMEMTSVHIAHTQESPQSQILLSPLALLLVAGGMWLLFHFGRGRNRLEQLPPLPAHTGSISRWGSGLGLYVPALLAGGAAVVILVMGLFFLLLEPQVDAPAQLNRGHVVAETVNVIVPVPEAPKPSEPAPTTPPPSRPAARGVKLTQSAGGSDRPDAINRAFGKLQVQLAGYVRDNLNLDWTPTRAFIEKELNPTIEDKPDVDLGDDNQGRPLGLAVKEVEVSVHVVPANHAAFEKQARADTREERVFLGAKIIGGLFAVASLLGLVMLLASNRLFMPVLMAAGVVAGLATAYCYRGGPTNERKAALLPGTKPQAQAQAAGTAKPIKK